MTAYAFGATTPLGITLGEARLNLIADLSSVSIEAGAATNTSLSPDAAAATAADASATTIRAGVDAVYNAVNDIEALSATAEATLRLDSGDARDGFGIEITGGLNYGQPDSPLTFDANLHLLLTHSDDISQWALEAGIAYTPNPGGSGLSLSFKPGWGIMADNRQALWDEGVSYRDILSGLGRHTPSLHYTLEMNYAIPLFAGREMLTLTTRRNLNKGRMSHRTYLQYHQTF